MEQDKFNNYLAEEMKNQKGKCIPVKASILERLIVNKLPFSKLHPNPTDEFSDPRIGPNYRIIADYERQIITNRKKEEPVFEDPIMVEKIRPSGYMILNGHHRWAAAMHVGLKNIPVKIINLAQETDIMKILERSEHDRRITLDLDEVVFCSESFPHKEKALGFPFNIRHKQRIRLGIPALFYFFAQRGYDIWVYSANYYSIDDIREFFKCYGVRVDAIITGTSGKGNKTQNNEAMAKLIANRYSKTLHIDNDMILLTRNVAGEFEEYPLNSSAEDWSREVITVVEEMEKNEQR